MIAAVPFGGSVSASVLSAGPPLALALGLFGRAALTRGPVDVVLAAFAVPCFFASLWATYSLYFTAPGAYWGAQFALGSGTILAFAVVVDRLLVRWIRANSA